MEESVRKVLDFLRGERVPRSLIHIEDSLNLGKEEVLAATAILHARKAIARVDLRFVCSLYSETSTNREYWVCTKSAEALLDAWDEEE